jgi:hypothetical protein
MVLKSDSEKYCSHWIPLQDLFFGAILVNGSAMASRAVGTKRPFRQAIAKAFAFRDYLCSLNCQIKRFGGDRKQAQANGHRT